MNVVYLKNAKNSSDIGRTRRSAEAPSRPAGGKIADLIDAQKFRDQEAGALKIQPKEIFALIDVAEERGRKRGLKEAKDVLADLVNNGHDDAGGGACIAYDIIKDRL